jgi:hypothetical protein
VEKRTGDTDEPMGLTPAESWLWRHRKVLTTIFVGAVVVDQLLYNGLRLRSWDWLLVTGATLYLALLPLSLSEPQRVADTLHLLGSRLEVPTTDSVAEVEASMHRRARRWAGVGGWAAMPVALGVWYWAYAGNLLLHAGLAVVEIIASVPIGRFVGRAVAYGGLGRHLRRADVAVAVTPGHLDGAAGLRPVGDLYLFQASMIGAIAAYLGLWWLITPVFFPRYLPWRNAYLGLLVAVLGCEFLTFLAPMAWFHQRMQSEKRRLMLKDGNELSERASVVEEEILRVDDAGRAARQEELMLLRSRYSEIESMPTWPVSAPMRRRFAVRNVVLFLPIVANALSAPKSWQGLLDQVSKTISGS